MLSLHDHVQELRAELSRCCDAREIKLIEAELRAAQAELMAQRVDLARLE